MSESQKQHAHCWWEADLLSPKDFVRHAVLICVVFAVAHLFGMREFTSVLNGTTGSVDLDWQTASVLGIAYILLYLAFVLLVPAMLLAAAMLAIWHRFVQSAARES